MVSKMLITTIPNYHPPPDPNSEISCYLLAPILLPISGKIGAFWMTLDNNRKYGGNIFSLFGLFFQNKGNREEKYRWKRLRFSSILAFFVFFTSFGGERNNLRNQKTENNAKKLFLTNTHIQTQNLRKMGSKQLTKHAHLPPTYHIESHEMIEKIPFIAKSFLQNKKNCHQQNRNVGERQYR